MATERPDETARQLVESLGRELSDEEFSDVLTTLAETRSRARVDQTDPGRLLELYQLLREEHEFRPGDLVRWKPGLRNRGFPDGGAPAVVIEVLDEPIYDPESGSDTTYFREPLDLIVGVIDTAGDLLTFYFDSRRFEPFE